jgi:hypothetical protein
MVKKHYFYMYFTQVLCELSGGLNEEGKKKNWHSLEDILKKSLWKSVNIYDIKMTPLECREIKS